MIDLSIFNERPDHGNTPEIQGFPGSRKKMQLLSNYICHFRKEDVIRAVYCLNSWGPNRSLQETALALNGLLIIGSFGEERIETYDQFVSFCRAIAKQCPKTYADDYTLPVFGNEYVLYNENYFRVYLGCGAEREYFSSVFLPSLDSKMGSRDQTLSVLSYMDKIIGLLCDSNENKASFEVTELAIPSHEYWSLVVSLFDGIGDFLPSEQIISIFSGSSCPIEKSHFVFVDDVAFPLFNASLLMDYMDYIISENDESRLIDIANEAIGALCVSMFSPDGTLLPSVIPEPWILIDNKPKYLGLGALVISKQRALFFLGSDSPSMTKDAIRLIEQALLQGADFVSGVSGSSRKRKGLRIMPKCPHSIVVYSSSMSPNSSGLILRDGLEVYSQCSALDAACIVSLADTPEELYDFFEFECSNRQNQSFASFEGLSGSFLAWKQSNGVLIRGAEDKHNEVNVFSLCGEVDAEVFKVFERYYSVVATDSLSTIFGYPFKWHAENNHRGFVCFSEKGLTGIEYLARRFSNGSVVLIRTSFADYVDMDQDRSQSEGNLRLLIEDALMVAIRELEEDFEAIVSSLGGLLICNYVLHDSYQELGTLVSCSKYGIAARPSPSSSIEIEIAANEAVFLGNLAQSRDRSVEIAVIESVLSALSSLTGIKFEKTAEKLRTLSAGKKKVDTIAVELPYQIIPSNPPSIPEAVIYTVGKEIAFVCDDVGIQPGCYQGKAANTVARKIQIALVSSLENKLSEYDMLSVHIISCSVCAKLQHNDYVNRKRAGSFAEIEKNEREFVRDKAIREREESRLGVLALCYLIETNLALSPRAQDVKKCTLEDFFFLYEYCLRLTGFLSNADMFYGDPDTLTLVVEDNYLTQVEENETLIEKSIEMKKRQLDERCRYLADDGADAKYATKAVAAFEKDTGFPFSLMLDTCSYLARVVPNTNLGETVAECVITADLDILADGIMQYLENRYERKQILKAIDFLCLDASRVKMDQGRRVSYVPFGRAKTRPDRYDIKPIFANESHLYFSPVSVAFAEKRWLDGISQRFLPCKLGFDNTYKAISEWKTAYEKSLEIEVEKAFLASGLKRRNVFRRLELHKKGDHPLELGDYDVVAFDESSNVLWLVECKEIEKTETAFDYMNYQKRFFGTGSDSEGLLSKFKNRIDYVTRNLITVMNDLALSCTAEVAIRPVVVMNKPFMDITLKFPYEVMALWEFEEYLDLSD